MLPEIESTKALLKPELSDVRTRDRLLIDYHCLNQLVCLNNTHFNGLGSQIFLSKTSPRLLANLTRNLIDRFLIFDLPVTFRLYPQSQNVLLFILIVHVEALLGLMVELWSHQVS